MWFRHKIPVPAPTSVFCPVITDSCPSGTMLTEQDGAEVPPSVLLAEDISNLAGIDLLDGESHGK